MAQAFEAVAIEKVSAVAYLRAVFAAWRAARVVLPLDRIDGDAPPGITITAREHVKPGGGWFDERLDPDDSPYPAQISLTSGTTGTPKAILLSRRALSDVTARLIAAQELDATVREYVGVPVTFSFGLGRARAIAAVGGRAYLPERGFRADELAGMLARGEVNAFSAVPTLLRVVLQQRELFAGCGAKLKWLEIGSQAMAADEKAAVAALFPNARIVQHYGLTEASRTTFLRIDEGAALESVGRPSGQAELRVGEDGHIAIRGPHVADGMVTAAGLVPLADAEGWLRTNDLGHVDEQGFVHYQGRADHLINVGGIKVPAELFEERLAARIGGDAARVAVAAKADPLRGEAVMVAHLAAVSAARLAEHVRATGASFGLGAADVSLVEVAEIPRTETGKIRRGVLTERHGAVAEPSALIGLDAPPADPAMSPREAEIAAIWRESLGVWPIGRDESFFDIGGDSLSAIQVMLRMERAGIDKALTQQIFEGRTIAEIAAGLDDAATLDGGGGRTLRAVTTDAISITRAMLVLVVLATHWAPFALVRMGGLGRHLIDWSVPLFRMGTPGFAIVFGLGLGYFQAPVARTNPARLGARMRNSLKIVGGGIAVLALLRGTALWLDAGDLGADWPVRFFFGVLLYYLLIVLTAPLWLRLIARAPFPVVAALLVMIGTYAASLLLRATWPETEPNGFAQLARLMLVTRYSYPEMLGHTMLGLTIGLSIEEANARPDLARIARWAGAALFGGGVMLSFSVGLDDAWFRDVASLPQVLSYAGAVLLIFSVAFVAVRGRGGGRSGRGLVPFLVVLGTLAFPIYVGHEAVVPAMSILERLGLGHGAALAIPVVLFFAGLAFAMRRINRLYYG